MSRIVPVAHVPGHFDRKRSEVGRGRQDLESGIVCQPLADQVRQRRDIVGDRDHLGRRSW